MREHRRFTRNPDKKPSPPAEVLVLLAETPPRIAALTEGRSAAHLRARPAPEAWSAIELLAHLRACADVWGDCIAAILAEDHPTIRAIHPRAWMTQTAYPRLDFQTSFRAFASQRAALLATLEPLTATEWERTAMVTGAGKPADRNVYFFVRRMAKHEQSHFEQMARIVESLPS